MNDTRIVRPRRSFIFSPGLKPEMYPKALACGGGHRLCRARGRHRPERQGRGARQRDGPLCRAAGRWPRRAHPAHQLSSRGIRPRRRAGGAGQRHAAARAHAAQGANAGRGPLARHSAERAWPRHAPARHHRDQPGAGGRVRDRPFERAAGRAVLRRGGHGSELRCADTWESLLYARSRVVHAAASAELDVIDVPYLDLEDPRGMEAAARQARDLGFSGKGAIHPRQIPALNGVFTPDAAQIERARRILRTFEEADTGLVVIDGKLIEKPVLRDVHRILAIAERISAQDSAPDMTSTGGST